MIYSCIPIQVLELSKQKSLAAYISLPFAVKELISNLLIMAAALSSRRPSAGLSSHLLAPGQAQQLLFFDKDAVPHTLNFGNAPFLRSAWVSVPSRAGVVAFPWKTKDSTGVCIFSPCSLVLEHSLAISPVYIPWYSNFSIASIHSTWLRAARCRCRPCNSPCGPPPPRLR